VKLAADAPAIHDRSSWPAPEHPVGPTGAASPQAPAGRGQERTATTSDSGQIAAGRSTGRSVGEGRLTVNRAAQRARPPALMAATG